MKKLLILLALMLSASAFATPYVSLLVFPNNAQLQVTNNSNQEYNCSGSVMIYKESGAVHSEHYFRIIRAYENNVQYINNYTYNDNFRTGMQSVFCRPTRK